MAAWAIISQTILHAWRLRFPFVIVSLIFCVIIALPQFTTGDGSPEGDIRLYLLYGGHLCTFGLSLAAAIYSIWFENQERHLNVHYMLHSSPVSYQKLLCCRILAYLFMLMTMNVLFLSAMSFTARQHLNHLDMSTEAREELTSRLFEVRQHMPLSPIIEVSKENQRLEKRFQEAITLESGKRMPFALPLAQQKSQPSLRGKLFSMSKTPEAILRVSLVSQNRVLWSQNLRIVPGQEFKCSLPSPVMDLKDKNIECHLTQVNPDKSPLYMTLNDPISMTHPAGSLWSNLFRAGSMIGLLFLILATLSIFISQIMSTQGSLLTLFIIYLVGSCKESIRALLFPVASPYMPTPAQTLEAFSFSDLFYGLVWKPILWFVPDFQALNPTSALMNGEFIRWTTLLKEMTSALPFLLVSSFYLFYFLPRQEKALQK